MGKSNKENNVVHVASVVVNTVFVALLWVVFRSDNIGQALDIFRGIFRVQGITYVNVYVVVYLVVIIFTHILGAVNNGGHAFEPNINLNRFIGRVVFCTWIFLIIVFMYVGDSAFIYAQF